MRYLKLIAIIRMICGCNLTIMSHPFGNPKLREQNHQRINLCLNLTELSILAHLIEELLLMLNIPGKFGVLVVLVNFGPPSS